MAKVFEKIMNTDDRRPQSPKRSQEKKSFIQELPKTLWLFTASDFATFAGPDTLFGIAAALAGTLLDDNANPDLLVILLRLPMVILWTWLNLLIADLANQRSPAALAEDLINKPWRPLPSGRVTVDQARHMLFCALPIVLTLNYFLGAWEETLVLFSLTWMYNDLGGADDSWILRNVIIALAFSQYNKGAWRVSAQMPFAISSRAWWWLFITSCVVGSTMHMQDLKDQKGDAARGRRTAPLVLGDRFARWTLAVPIMLWSVVCPAFWQLSALGYVLPVGFGALIVYRILYLSGVKADKLSWEIWCGWTGIIWIVPLFKDYSVFVRFAQRFMA